MKKMISTLILVASMLGADTISDMENTAIKNIYSGVSVGTITITDTNIKSAGVTASMLVGTRILKDEDYFGGYIGAEVELFKTLSPIEYADYAINIYYQGVNLYLTYYYDLFNTGFYAKPRVGLGYNDSQLKYGNSSVYNYNSGYGSDYGIDVSLMFGYDISKKMDILFGLDSASLISAENGLISPSDARFLSFSAGFLYRF